MAGSRSRKARVTGIGGVFLKAKAPVELAAWYRKHLGLAIDAKGRVAVWRWKSPRDSRRVGNTLWAALKEHEREWGESRPTAQVNYRVDDFDRLLTQLRRTGVEVSGRVEESSYGRFGWAVDPEGNRLELWEPPAR